MSLRREEIRPQPEHFPHMLELAHRAELTRICHVLKALECAQDESLRREWRARVSESRERASLLARMLAQAGRPCAEPQPDASGDCLLEAMELALSNGDLVAAEAIARECVLLAEVHCTQAWRHVQQTMGAAMTLAA